MGVTVNGVSVPLPPDAACGPVELVSLVFPDWVAVICGPEAPDNSPMHVAARNAAAMARNEKKWLKTETDPIAVPFQQLRASIGQVLDKLSRPFIPSL
jgi:hypothetical protein